MLIWVGAVLGVAVLAVAGAAYVLFVRPLRDPHPRPFRAEGAVAVRGARILVSPDGAPIERGTVVVRNGLVAAVGPDVSPPPGARVLSFEGGVVVAGFWNAHVHFTERKWAAAGRESPAVLDAHLADMLTSRGFTTAVDLGSDPRVTVSLRRRIEAGELLGPAIYTSGAALYPPGAIPYYLRETLPPSIIRVLSQPGTPEEAARVAESNIRRGSDLMKVFTGSLVERNKVVPMSAPVARAAAEVAHRHRQLVFSHSSSLEGIGVAVESGVDVLAHAPHGAEVAPPELLRTLVERHVAIVPTLKMFATTVSSKPAFLDPIRAAVRQFHALGGQLLFGTDVGYMTDYRTEDELRLLSECGLGPREILAMLTTAPADRFGVSGAKGTIAPGMEGDLVVLDGDPDQDPTAFARVRATIRGGRVLYQRP
jgi:imidazolonepropionase-like amidohydrolase